MTSISDTEVVNAPGGLVEVARVTRTNGSSGINITATSVASASDFFSTPATFIADGSSYVVEVFIPLYYAMNGANYSSRLSLVSGSTEITRLTTQDTAVVFTGSSQFAKYIVTPSPGVVSYNVRAWVTANNSYIFCGNAGSDYPPAFLRVSKILQASQLLVTQSNAPIVTSLPVGNLVTGQEVDLYVTTPYAGYQRYKWNGTSWYMVGDSRGAEWQSYSPGITNITLGNGTLQSRYRVYGKTINYIGQLQWGSTTSASGYFVVNLPTNAYNSLIVGSVLMIDGGTRAWTGSCAPWSAGQFYIIHTESGNFGGVNQTNPFTWGNGDYFTWSITYEMA
jgi:hypothetical protein